jgi:putative transposase
VRTPALLRLFVRRGLLPADDARAMAQWQHGGGFSVDGLVRIAAANRAGRERLLRYCARPPLALDRLRELDPERLLYGSNKQGPGGNGPQILTPLELLDRLAALVPPPRIHRHRDFGVLAPNAPLRAAVTALALAAATTSSHAPNPQPAAEPAHRRAARYAWARLLARIYEVFPLVCPLCGAEMRIIALIPWPCARSMCTWANPPRRRASRRPGARKTPAPGVTVAPPRRRSASAPRRSGHVKTC